MFMEKKGKSFQSTSSYQGIPAIKRRETSLTHLLTDGFLCACYSSLEVQRPA